MAIVTIPAWKRRMQTVSQPTAQESEPATTNVQLVKTIEEPAVNTAVQLTAVNKRGAYPNTDARREYMRIKMREDRARKKAKGK